MMEHQEFAARSEALCRQFEAKLGVKARNLRQGFRRAGRDLPRRLRAHGALLVAAERDMGNPRVARQLDSAALRAGFDQTSAYLRAVDVADRRRGRLLSLAGVVAFNLLLVIVGFLVWLWWRGYV